MKCIKGMMSIFLIAGLLSGLQAASIRNMSGDVQILSPGETQWKTLLIGEPVPNGSEVKTAADSSIEIMAGRHRITIREKSQATVNDEEGSTFIKILFGRLRAKVAKLGRRQTFSVRTPAAVASVRGTEFECHVGKDGETKVDCFEGAVSVGDVAGIGQEVMVHQGQTCEVISGQPVSAPEAIPLEMLEGAAANEVTKREIEREVGIEIEREAVESAAAYEMRTAQYQEGKSLIDAFGKRVRLEEYITRPDANTFKMVVLNTREDRFDFGFMEIVANKTLPEDLSEASGLWGSLGDTPPDIYATKYRYFMSNTVDSWSDMGVDGSPQKVTYPDFTFNPETNAVSAKGTTGYETIFAHRYTFLNAASATMDSVWSGASRPAASLANGILQHLVPISETGNFNQWFYTPTDGLTSQFEFIDTGEPFKAHFAFNTNYHNYTTRAGAPKARWNGSAWVADTTAFDSTASAVGAKVASVRQDQYIINDSGDIFDFSSLFSQTAGRLEGANFADLIRRLNFEMVVKSDLFKGPENKLDLVISPKIMLDAGLIDLESDRSQEGRAGM